MKITAMMLAAVTLLGCTNGQLSPTVVSVTTSTLELLACGMNVYVKDSQAAPNWVQMAIDMATQCGMDVADIVAIFGANSGVGQAAAANAAVVNASAAAFKAKGH